MAILVLLAVSIWLIRYGVKRERKFKCAPVAAPVYRPPIVAPTVIPKERSEELSTVELQAWRMYHVQLLDAFIAHARQSDWTNKDILIRSFEDLKTEDYYTEYAKIIHGIVLHPELYEGSVRQVRT